MNINTWMMLAVCLLSTGVLVGFFKTKTRGFGRFATSVLLVLVVLSFSALLFVGERIEATSFVNILFAVIGFAGGLFTGKDTEK